MKNQPRSRLVCDAIVFKTGRNEKTKLASVKKLTRNEDPSIDAIYMHSIVSKIYETSDYTETNSREKRPSKS